jgi:pentatricopeptide repeat protein
LYLVKHHEERPSDYLKPEAKAFGIVMDGYATESSIESVSKLEDILRSLEERLDTPEAYLLNVQKYTALMKAYIQTFDKEALPKVEELMKRMEAMANKYNKPRLRPDQVNYTMLMKAILLHGGPGYARRVESVLHSMKADPREKVSKPNVYACSLALEAWAKSGQPDAWNRMDAILQSMERPDTACYNSMIQLYSNQEKSEQALNLVQQMRSDYESGENPTCRPDVVTYTSLMDGLRRQSHVKDKWTIAHSIFQKMLAQYHDGDDACKPTRVTFAILLHFLAGSAEPRVKHKEAERLWETAKELNEPLSKNGMYAFVKACGATEGDDEELRQAFGLVEQVFGESGDMANDPRIYVELLQACHNLLRNKDECAQGLEFIFKQCASHDCVNEYVLSKLNKVCPEKMFTQLVQQTVLHDKVE